ncbi:hypothetical protein ETB97_012274 [Aspergillus alliaceus]|uniref:Ankyrin repeat domain-containing protein n=1 Tax=Petromyces alliaceus TaxID=209559 RepID=A0A8H6A7F8_PETAA|nr:hypothetical protein ETB97_012274 [Aspergillus burnettii]
MNLKGWCSHYPEHGAPLDSVDGRFPEDHSVLGEAIISCFLSIIPVLLKAGAKPGDKETPTPLERAISTDQPEMVQILVEAGYRLADDHSLCTIAEQGNKAPMEIVIDLGLDVEMCWQGALFVAIIHGQREMVELLIEKGANPHLTHDVFTRDYECWRYNTIGFAVLFKQLEILRLLLDMSVRPEKEDLMLARDERFEEAVALLKGYSFDDVPEKQHISEFLD